MPREPAETAPAVPVGVAFNYHHASEHIHVVLPSVPGRPGVGGTTDVALYSSRIDAAVLGCALAPAIQCLSKQVDPTAPMLALDLSLLGGYADGSTTFAGATTDLHGPAFGTGALLLLTGSVIPVEAWSWQTKIQPFLVGGFDYVATDFSAIRGWVDTFTVKPRAGMTIQTAKRQTENGVAYQGLDLYSGASWEDFSKEQTTTSGVPLLVSPKQPWAALVGANYRFGKGWALSAEGELGDRQAVTLALRYQFDVFLRGMR
jgi:hypothetical protein